MPESEKKGITAMEMDSREGPVKFRRRDKIRKKVIERKMKFSDTVEEEMLRRQIIWYGHVRRMEKNRELRMAMCCKADLQKEKGKIKENMVWWNKLSNEEKNRKRAEPRQTKMEESLTKRKATSDVKNPI